MARTRPRPISATFRGPGRKSNVGRRRRPARRVARGAPDLRGLSVPQAAQAVDSFLYAQPPSPQPTPAIPVFQPSPGLGGPGRMIEGFQRRRQGMLVPPHIGGGVMEQLGPPLPRGMMEFPGGVPFGRLHPVSPSFPPQGTIPPYLGGGGLGVPPFVFGPEDEEELQRRRGLLDRRMPSLVDETAGLPATRNYELFKRILAPIGF